MRSRTTSGGSSRSVSASLPFLAMNEPPPKPRRRYVTYHDDLIEPELVPFAVAIGALCTVWARLESSTRCLFMVVAGMPSDKNSFGIAHCLDIRDQLNAIKLAFVATPRDRRLTEFAVSTINYIDNVLRVKRNRYVHDSWNVEPYTGTVERTNYTPRLYRPQSRQFDWSPLDIAEENLGDLWLVVREVKEHASVLSELQLCFREREGALEALLSAPPQRRFLQAQPGKQNP